MAFGDSGGRLADEVLADFLEHGAHVFLALLDQPACARLLASLKADRGYGAELFLSEAAFDADPQYRGVNPRPGRNLLETFARDLGFVEEAPSVVAGLTALLGDDYEIMDRKVVCGVPADAIPAWLKARIAGNPVNNLGPYVKPEYRDVTYFYGIDFHQDLIDYKEREADFVTLYVYLHPVTAADAPLFLLDGSHRLGAAVFPHNLERTGAETWLYRNGATGEAETRRRVLMGAAGSPQCGTPAPFTAPSRTTPTTSASLCATYSARGAAPSPASTRLTPLWARPCGSTTRGRTWTRQARPSSSATSSTRLNPGRPRAVYRGRWPPPPGRRVAAGAFFGQGLRRRPTCRIPGSHRGDTQPNPRTLQTALARIPDELAARAAFAAALSRASSREASGGSVRRQAGDHWQERSFS